MQSIVRRQSKILLQLYDECIKKRCFPKVWKKTRLILLKKCNKPQKDPSSYRPICLLDSPKKLFEEILDNMLRRLLEEPGESNLSEYRYGFRADRSTIDAVEYVYRTMEEFTNKRKTGMVMINIKNAFNSASWAKILEAMDRINFPQYLCQMVDSYLRDRSITYEDRKELHNEQMISCGVPQGSILGPILWNILNDGLLKTILPAGTKLLVFADDVTIIATVEDTMQLKILLEQTTTRAVDWLSKAGLQIAPQKSEVLVLTRQRHHNEMTITISETAVNSSPSAKYLWITIDQKLNFTKHATSTPEKANKMVQNIIRILPNVSAAKHRKRLLLSNAVHFVLLYGAPIWTNRMSRQG